MSDYNRHMLRHHTPGATFSCNECDYVGTTQKHLADHNYKQHRPYFECDNTMNGCCFKHKDKRASGLLLNTRKFANTNNTLHSQGDFTFIHCNYESNVC